MHVVRFSLSLFVLVAVLTALPLNAILLAYMGTTWLHTEVPMVSALWVLTFAVPVTLWAAFAAWRWRRRAALVGIMLMAGVGLAMALWMTRGPHDRFSYFADAYTWGHYILGLSSAIVAYLVSLFLLRRSPLLAQASP